MESRNEELDTNHYRENSEIYKNVQKAVAVLPPGVFQYDLEKDRLQSLSKAKTFSEMFSIVNAYHIEHEWAQFSVKAAAGIFSIFSAPANFAYYAIQLKNDILHYAIERGYHPVESNEKSKTYIAETPEYRK